jgi:hypothetical protein
MWSRRRKGRLYGATRVRSEVRRPKNYVYLRVQKHLKERLIQRGSRAQDPQALHGPSRFVANMTSRTPYFASPTPKRGCESLEDELRSSTSTSVSLTRFLCACSPGLSLSRRTTIDADYRLRGYCLSFDLQSVYFRTLHEQLVDAPAHALALL